MRRNLLLLRLLLREWKKEAPKNIHYYGLCASLEELYIYKKLTFDEISALEDLIKSKRPKNYNAFWWPHISTDHGVTEEETIQVRINILEELIKEEKMKENK